MQPIANSTDHKDRQHLLHPNANARLHEAEGALEIAAGDGIYVIDHSGKRYIEALSGLWCAGLGFSEKRLVRAATRQMEQLPYYHLFTNKVTGPAADLAERLLEIAPVPMRKVFLTSSGSEANDTAIKMIWFRSNAMGRPQKKKLIARVGGFHGVTIGAGSLTGIPATQKGFDLPIAGVFHVSKPHYWRNCLAGETEEAFSTRMAQELEDLILREGSETVAAFFAEPVMGGGGVILPPATYWAKIQAVLRKYDVLLVADEVICGFGRTGKMFGSQTYDIKPDIMVVSKQLSSAYMPIAAVLISNHVYQPLADGSAALGLFGHGLTAGGHPTAAAVALETLRIIETDGLVERARLSGDHLRHRLEELRDHPLVGEIRSVGLLAGIEMVYDRATKAAFGAVGDLGRRLNPLLQDRGLILRVIGDTIALCPPLITTPAEIDLIVDRLQDGLAALTDQIAHP